MIAGLSEWMIYALIMAFGATLAVVFPYLLNKWNDAATTVNWKYVAVLVFSIFLSVLFAMPDKIDVIDLSVLKIALLSGYGLSAIVGKTVKTIIERQADPSEPAT